MKKFLKIASFLFLLVSFIGCKPEVKVKPKTGSIQGKVVYENENVTDYSGIQVTLFSTNGLMATDYCVSRGIATNARSVESVGITNAAGEYLFENVPEGVYTIYASSNSSTKKAVATNVVVRAAETVTAEILGLTATGSISGKITIDYSTVDVLGLDVFIAGTSFIAKVGNDGRYEISNIPAKRGYVLCVQKGEKTIQLNSTLEVKADSITNLGTKNMSSKEWETASFKWLGSFNLKPTNPKLYEAYFDTTDGCSYIWNGSNWDLLAQAGKDGADGTNGKDGEDGTSINWRGNYSDSRDIDNPQYLDAYFNTTDGCSYIWNGYSWELLVQKGADGTDGISIRWLGSYSDSSYIYDPQYLDAYFNTTDGCSYIYTYNGWELLVQKGTDGKGINWLGSYSGSYNIDNPQYLDAYFNTTDGCSYIYTNYGYWTLLAQKGETGESINWRGHYYDSSEISDPQNLDVYFNVTDGCSYIYTDYGWSMFATKGEAGADGASLNWLGNYISAEYIFEYEPKYMDAYFNETDGCSYIYTRNGWELFIGKGYITWLGNYASVEEIISPKNLDAYFNTTDGCSYIYTNNGWTLLAQKGDAGTDGIDGTDGASINWRGSYSSSEEIEEPQYLDAYFNTTDGCSYIYSNNGWELLAQKGDAGTDGKTINWLGSYSDSSEISEPQLLWAYYNITDGCSYIYNGNEWQLLTRKGTDGVTGSGDGGIRWLGTFDSEYEIYNPVAMDAYFNSTTGCSYIYNGTYWVMLARAGADGLNGIDGIDGTDGEDGTSINWRGSHSSANDVYNPQYMDAYWNTTENCAYIYNGYSWTVLIKGPASGGTGSSSSNIGSEVGANVVGTVLIGWDKPSEVVRIPNGVTDIAENVFKNKDNITRVIIPSSVENIGISAFYDCDSLTSVEFLGSGLKNIQESAFESCGNLVNIILPSSLESIGAYAFRYDSKLTTVNIPDSVVSIQSEAYADCLMLRTLTFGSGLTTLKYRTFYNCDALVSVTIPNSIINISETVFYGCSALSVLNVNGIWKNSYYGTEAELEISLINKSASYNPDVWIRID